jgi:hypothetical protein
MDFNTCVIKWLALKNGHTSLKICHLVTYATCFKNMNGWKCTSILYKHICKICCMQQDVMCYLSYAIKEKINCMCCMQLKFNYKQ